MRTGFPFTGNLVAGNGGSGRARSERGIALISVVAVLVLLGLVVTPFMMTQRDSAARGDRFLYTARTSLEADSLFALVRSEMLKSIEHVEYEELRALGPGASAQGGKRPPMRATPSSDTLAEFELSPDVLARFNDEQVRGGRRVWDVDVIDQQGLINLNGASAPILANVLGRSELSDAIEADTDLIPVVDSSVFPEKGGVVRIGSEVIKYTAVSGSALVGCERAYRSDLGVNGQSAAWEKGDPVLLEAAVQIALRPFLAKKGSWLRYTNIYQARTIAGAGVTALAPEEFDKLRRVSTVWSGNVVGDGWSNPQLVQESISSGSAGEVSVQIKNPRYFGPGTIVKITDGVNADYAMVAKVKGDLTISLVGEIEHSYEADQTYMYALARTPVNVNTATTEMLTLVFTGLKLRGRGVAFDANRAEALAQFLKAWDNPDDEDATPGTFRNWEDFTSALEDAQQNGTISQEDAQAVLLNAMNANDAALQFSTIPFSFRSYDVFELRATASIQDVNNGRELARRELRRVVSVGTARTGTLVLESQDDFQRQIMKSRTGRWWATFPDNVNAYYDGRNIPASEYGAFMNQNRFPSTSRDAAEGDLQLLPAAVRFVGRQDPDRVHHFDSSDIPDGLEIEGTGYTLTVGEEYSVQDRTIDLLQFREGPSGSDENEVGIRPFAVSFWYRPRWERGSGNQTIFDYAADDEDTNRVRLYYDDERDLLVLSVADATAHENSSYEVFYDFQDHTWEADQWYHFAANVQGAGPGLCELFLDGEKVGRADGITRLQQNLPESGTIASIQVENTDGFPERGTLYLQSEDGAELIEYDGKGETSFTVVRRKARSINRLADEDEPRSHPEGTVVELYGFSGPLYTDVKTGGATLAQTIGPWRAYRLIANDTSTFDSISATDPNGNAVTFVGIGSNATDTNQVVSGIQLQDWDTGSTDPNILDDLGAVGTEGIAMVAVGPSDVQVTVTGGGTYAAGPNSGQPFDELITQHVEFVRYRVTGSGQIEFVQRQLELIHHQMAGTATGNPRFIPSYDYGDTASPQTQADGNGQPGFLTAFIPIAVLAQGSADSYLNPLDELTQLDSVQSTRHAYVQIDGEWIKYDTVDDQVVAGSVAFYHDQRIDNAAALFNAAGTLEFIEPIESAPTSTPGGPGSSPGADPPQAEDLNTDDDLPAEATSAGSLAEPPISSEQIAAALDFRGYLAPNADMEFYIANTIPREHASGTQVVPCFRVVAGNELELNAWNNAVRGAFPGFNDLITLRDTENSTELIRLQWGYMGWCAPTQSLSQPWGWDQIQTQNPNADLRRLDSRGFTRALMGWSGEMPDIGLTTAQQPFGFGVDGLEGTVSAATIDELMFHVFPESPDDRPNWTLLGEVPQEVIQAATGQLNVPAGQEPPEPVFEGIDEETDIINVHTSYWNEDSQSYVINGLGIAPEIFQEEGGILRINDELILYESFDPQSGEFSGCLRGTFGTEPQPHPYNSRVSAVRCFASSVLTSSADASSASFQVADARRFPDDGYLRIADGAEIIGYTERQGNSLNGPLGRIDPAQAAEEGEDARVGGGLFRGRFGTTPDSYQSGDVVVHLPSRYYDRYAEFSDHPEMSYAQFSWTKPGAIWKRISWAQRPVENVEIIALLRFSGGPPWDSDEIVRLPSGDIPRVDRRSKIYEISATDKGQLNLLNVEADRLEVRLLVRYAGGAYRRIYDAGGEPVPNSWKESPWVKKLTVEYVAPTLVLSQE